MSTKTTVYSSRIPREHDDAIAAEAARCGVTPHQLIGILAIEALTARQRQPDEVVNLRISDLVRVVTEAAEKQKAASFPHVPPTAQLGRTRTGLIAHEVRFGTEELRDERLNPELFEAAYGIAWCGVELTAAVERGFGKSCTKCAYSRNLWSSVDEPEGADAGSAA